MEGNATQFMATGVMELASIDLAGAWCSKASASWWSVAMVMTTVATLIAFVTNACANAESPHQITDLFIQTYVHSIFLCMQLYSSWSAHTHLCDTNLDVLNIFEQYK